MLPSRTTSAHRSMPRLAIPALLAGAIASCEADPAPAIMLAISTDMALPDDVSHVGLRITSEDEERLGQVIFEDVRPTYDAENGRYVSFPATLAVLPGERDAPRVRIRVVAFRAPIVDGVAVDTEAEAIVLRNVVTTVPTDRVALLSIPILFASQGGATGSLANVNATDLGAIRSTCAVQEESNVAGRCVGAEIDSSSLPDYTGLASIDGGRCFPTAACFAGAVRVAVDTSDCSAAAPPAAEFNLGFERVVPIAESDPQRCVEEGDTARCFVPLAAESEYGWQRSGDRISFAPGVCAQLAGGLAEAIAGSTACEPKPLEVSPCGPWNPSTTEAEVVDPDGGLDGVGGGGGGGGGSADPRFGSAAPIAEVQSSPIGTLTLGAINGTDVLRVSATATELAFERCTPTACSPLAPDGTLFSRSTPPARVAFAASGQWLYLADRGSAAYRLDATTGTLEAVVSQLPPNSILSPAHAVARAPGGAVLEHVWFAADFDDGANVAPRLFYAAPGQPGATAMGGSSLGVLSNLDPPLDLTDARYDAMAGFLIETQPALALASGPYLLRCNVAAPADMFNADPPCVASTAPAGLTYTHVAGSSPPGEVLAIRVDGDSGNYEVVVEDFGGGAATVIATGGGYLATDDIGIDVASDGCFDYAILREPSRTKVRAFRSADRTDTVDLIDADLVVDPTFPVSLATTPGGVFVGFAGPGGGGGVRFIPKNFDLSCNPLP